MREQGASGGKDELEQELDLDAKTVQDLEPSEEGAEKVVGGVPIDSNYATCTCAHNAC